MVCDGIISGGYNRSVSVLKLANVPIIDMLSSVIVWNLQYILDLFIDYTDGRTSELCIQPQLCESKSPKRHKFTATASLLHAINTT